MIRVLLVDDQAMVRSGLARILDNSEKIQVVGECSDGDEVKDAIVEHTPDVILMDVRMKRMDGISATKEIRSSESAPPVLMLTTFGEDKVLWGALQAGAAGFVLKDATTEDLVRATETVASGGAWFCPAVAERVMAKHQKIVPINELAQRQINSLTHRELEVLTLMARGATNTEIADRICVGEATVKTHISNLFGKIEARDRAAAVVFAFDHGVVNTQQMD